MEKVNLEEFLSAIGAKLVDPNNMEETTVRGKRSEMPPVTLGDLFQQLSEGFEERNSNDEADVEEVKQLSVELLEVNERLREKLNEFEAKVTKLEEIGESKSRFIEKRDVLIQTLRKDLYSMKDTIEEQKDALTNLRKENDKQNSIIVELTKEKQNLENEVAALRSQIKDLTDMKSIEKLVTPGPDDQVINMRFPNANSATEVIKSLEKSEEKSVKALTPENLPTSVASFPDTDGDVLTTVPRRVSIDKNGNKTYPFGYDLFNNIKENKTKDKFDIMQAEADALINLMRAKDKDYGSSFDNMVDEFGMVAAVIPLKNKVDRVSSIVKNGGAALKTESMEDSVKDLAGYALMTLAYIKKDNN